MILRSPLDLHPLPHILLPRLQHGETGHGSPQPHDEMRAANLRRTTWGSWRTTWGSWHSQAQYRKSPKISLKTPKLSSFPKNVKTYIYMFFKYNYRNSLYLELKCVTALEFVRTPEHQKCANLCTVGCHSLYSPEPLGPLNMMPRIFTFSYFCL